MGTTLLIEDGIMEAEALLVDLLVVVSRNNHKKSPHLCKVVVTEKLSDTELKALRKKNGGN